MPKDRIHISSPDIMFQTAMWAYALVFLWPPVRVIIGSGIEGLLSQGIIVYGLLPGIGIVWMLLWWKKFRKPYHVYMDEKGLYIQWFDKELYVPVLLIRNFSIATARKSSTYYITIRFTEKNAFGDKQITCVRDNMSDQIHTMLRETLPEKGA